MGEDVKWSAVELAELRRLEAQELTWREIAQRMGRTMWSVKHKADRIRPVNRWTRHDLNELRRLHAAGESVPALARRFGRSRSAMYRKLSELGLVRYADWTNRQVEKLRAEYRRKPIGLLAKEIGKSPAAVRSKAYKMGLTRKHRC